MKPLIEALNLSKSFRQRKAVDNLSLSINEGEIFGLVGSDGAGKTTTLRLLCGALRPDRGQVNIAGYDLLRHTEQARVHMGYLAQRFSLYEDLTVLENIRFFAEVRGIPAAEWRPRCMEILKFVGLDDFARWRAGNLSGGMRQKLGLAAALVHLPRVLLLDEPTTGVDPVTRQDFWQLIIRLASRPGSSNNNEDERVAVLVSTPYMDEAARCTTVGFIQHGQLLVEGKPGELTATLEGRIIELLGKPLGLLRRIAESDQGVEATQMFGDRLHLRVHSGKAQEVIDRLGQDIITQGGHVHRLRTVSASLEDVFISLLEKHV